MDVCPFIPVRGVTMDDCIECAKELGAKLANELGVPGMGPPLPSLVQDCAQWIKLQIFFDLLCSTVYLYGEAAKEDYRTTVPQLRAGEYEGLPDKVGIARVQCDILHWWPQSIVFHEPRKYEQTPPTSSLPRQSGSRILAQQSLFRAGVLHWLEHASSSLRTISTCWQPKNKLTELHSMCGSREEARTRWGVNYSWGLLCICNGIDSYQDWAFIDQLLLYSFFVHWP